LNLLLHPDPVTSEKFLSLLGVAASLTTVDHDEGYTLFANNQLTRDFYGAAPLGVGVKLDVESIKPLLNGERDPAAIEAYVEQMKRNYGTVVESRKTISTETAVMISDGFTRWSRNTLTPIYDGAQRVARILITFVDVSELYEDRKEIEDSLSSLISQVVKVCAACDKVAEGNDWLTMADYMQRHSEQEFSHGICKNCRDQYFGVPS
jgi:hypothetical protein